jgi:hypothetical protein
MTIPRWQCHKQVQAFKIGSIALSEVVGVWVLHPEVSDINAVEVDGAYIVKHKPKIGGYYVRYDDGYESWSPAATFEAGYTRIQ